MKTYLRIRDIDIHGVGGRNVVCTVGDGGDSLSSGVGDGVVGDGVVSIVLVGGGVKKRCPDSGLDCSWWRPWLGLVTPYYTPASHHTSQSPL